METKVILEMCPVIVNPSVLGTVIGFKPVRGSSVRETDCLHLLVSFHRLQCALYFYWGLIQSQITEKQNVPTQLQLVTREMRVGGVEEQNFLKKKLIYEVDPTLWLAGYAGGNTSTDKLTVIHWSAKHIYHKSSNTLIKRSISMWLHKYIALLSLVSLLFCILSSPRSLGFWINIEIIRLLDRSVLPSSSLATKYRCPLASYLQVDGGFIGQIVQINRLAHFGDCHFDLSAFVPLVKRCDGDEIWPGL